MDIFIILTTDYFSVFIVYISGFFYELLYNKYFHHHLCQCRIIACTEKLGGGGGGAQSNFPTRDHQNIFNLILTYIYYYYMDFVLGGGGGGMGPQPLWLYGSANGKFKYSADVQRCM